MEENIKNVLVIAYNYPPLNNGGVQRPLKFVKYLPQFGYNPIVLTVGNCTHSKNEYQVYRVNDWSNDTKKLTFRKFIFKALRKILYEFGLINSYTFFWYRDAIKEAYNIVKENKIDIIYATFPPVTDIQIGMYIREKIGIPLVADFRDGYAFEPLRKENIFRKLSNKYYERKIVNNSDYIITVSEPITNYFISNYNIKNIKTITNGFDDEDFQNIHKIDLGDAFNVVYTGRLSLSSSDQNIKAFVDILSEINNSNYKRRIKLIFLGELTKKEEIYLKSKLGVNFDFKGLLDHKEALVYQCSSDLLLFTASTLRKSVATTKLYEYIASGVPIFGLTQGTFAEKVINQTKTGICVSPDDKENIKEKLLSIIIDKKTEWFNPNVKEINKFFRKELTRSLVNVFDELLADK